MLATIPKGRRRAMHNLSQFRPNPEPIYPRPTLENIREGPNVVYCDLKWRSEDGGSQVEFYDLAVTMTGNMCGVENCGGWWIRGVIPSYEAFNGCCRCLDRNPNWTPAKAGAETYSRIGERLIRQLGVRVNPGDSPRPGDGAIAERNEAGEATRGIARALGVSPQRVRRRLRSMRRKQRPSLLTLNPNLPEAI
jgi:hypothetical protein